MVPWSTVTIAGKPLSQLMEERPDTYGKLDLDALAAEGKKGGWIILGGKGSTEFGIGASIAEVIRAVFGDENRVLPVSVYLDGPYGQHGVYAQRPGGIEPERRGGHHRIEAHRGGTEGVRRLLSDHD